jgi:hypothetical protein
MIAMQTYSERIILLLGKSYSSLILDTSGLESAINMARYDIAHRIAAYSPPELSGIVRLDSINTPPVPVSVDNNITIWGGSGVVPTVWGIYNLPPNVYEARAVYVWSNGTGWIAARRTIDRYAVASVGAAYVRPAPYQPVYFFRSLNASPYYQVEISTGANPPLPEHVEVWYLRMPVYLHMIDIDAEIPDYCFDAVVWRALYYIYLQAPAPINDKASLFLKLYNTEVEQSIPRLLAWKERSAGTERINVESQSLQQQVNHGGMDRKLQ